MVAPSIATAAGGAAHAGLKASNARAPTITAAAMAITAMMTAATWMLSGNRSKGPGGVDHTTDRFIFDVAGFPYPSEL